MAEKCRIVQTSKVSRVFGAHFHRRLRVGGMASEMLLVEDDGVFVELSG